MNWDLTPLYRDFDDPQLAADFSRAEGALADILAAVDQPALSQAGWEGAVEQRVFRVVVQVDKGHVRSPPGRGVPWCASLCRDMRVGYEDLSLTYACSFIVGHTT